MNVRRIVLTALMASAFAAPTVAGNASGDKQKSMSETQKSSTATDKSMSGDSTKNATGVSTNVLVEVADGDKVVDFFNVEVSKLKDKAIYGGDGNKIANIDSVLATAQGKSAAVTADIGGFLGIGEKRVVISVDAISFEGLRITVNLTRKEIESLPEWQG
jgi:Ni/Co efflux regulator RcnB